jgi:hypothetical protein
LVTKANVVEGGTTSAAWLYHQCNQSIHITDGMTVTSLSASLWTRWAATDHVGQIILNRKLWCIAYSKSHQSKNYCIHSKSCINFQHVKMKSCKKKLLKMRPTFNWFMWPFMVKESMSEVGLVKLAHLFMPLSSKLCFVFPWWLWLVSSYCHGICQG